MKVSRELPNSDAWQNLGDRALYLIATLPEEEREKERTLDSGETKPFRVFMFLPNHTLPLR